MIVRNWSTTLRSGESINRIIVTSSDYDPGDNRDNYCCLTNKLAKLNRLAALNISSIPTSVETSVTDTIGVAPRNIQAMTISSTPITSCSQLPFIERWRYQLIRRITPATQNKPAINAAMAKCPAPVRGWRNSRSINRRLRRGNRIIPTRNYDCGCWITRQ